MDYRLRIRDESGQNNIINCNSSITTQQLKELIGGKLSIGPDTISLKTGYPPKSLVDDSILSECGVEDGDTLIMEIIKVQQKPQQSQPPATLTQIPDSNGLIMIRRIIKADNSCLFNAISYAISHAQISPPVSAIDMRKLVCKLVAADKVKYNEIVLEKTNSTYQSWILDSKSWGGYIECEILSNHYKVQICAVQIQTTQEYYFGPDTSEHRIYLLFDGIHYDVLVKNICEDMDQEMDVGVMEPTDQRAYEGARFVALELKHKKQFTDTSKFQIQCGICYECFEGQKQAVEHNVQTGHINFQEVK